MEERENMLVFNLNLRKKKTKRRDGWMERERETYRGVGFVGYVVFGSFVLLSSSSSSLRDVGSVMFSMFCFLVLKGDMVPMVKQSECEPSSGQDLHKSVVHIT